MLVLVCVSCVCVACVSLRVRAIMIVSQRVYVLVSKSPSCVLSPLVCLLA